MNRPAGPALSCCRIILLAIAISCVGAATSASARTKPVLPAETNDVATLSPAGPHRLFLLDPYVSPGMNVLDADDAQVKTLGLVPTSHYGMMSLSRAGEHIYVAETYWSHGNRGERADLLSVYDGRTLLLEKEISLPSRFLATAKIGQISASSDEKLGYVYSMIPSSVVYVADIALGKVIGSVNVPGCALALAYGPNHFATICGDGTVGAATVNSSQQGKVAFSEKFFDANTDPLFENSIVDRSTGEAWLMSYTGKIYPAAFGDKPVVDKPWSIQVAAGFPEAGTGAQELAWRPGGGQLMAIHRATKRLYILMHAGNYWTHKDDGTEVWVLDAEKRTLLRRITLKSPASGIAVTQDQKPLLYAMGGAGHGLAIYDAMTGELLRQRNISGSIALVPGL